MYHTFEFLFFIFILFHYLFGLYFHFHFNLLKHFHSFGLQFHLFYFKFSILSSSMKILEVFMLLLQSIVDYYLYLLLDDFNLIEKFLWLVVSKFLLTSNLLKIQYV